MSKYWLKCDVDGGMLPDEQAVAVTTADGKKVFLFAGDEKVKSSGGTSYIMVELVDQNSSYGLVRLPSMPMEGSAVVKVSNDLLSPAR
jgi:hypothetical protein